MKNAVRLSERDNVAVLLEPLKAKEQLIYMDEAAALHSCTVMEDIPIYHKAALCDIQAGERIMKYGECIRFLYKGIIIKHNKTEPTYTKTSLFLCEKRRFFMARTEKGVVATI